jgi:hypothetical protein
MFAMAGPLPNRKHEIFAVELATGAPLESAYLTAGYKAGRAARFNASRLRNKPHLRERINELFVAAAKDAVVGIGWLQYKLIDIIEGKAESRSGFRDGKPFEERDRMGALVALARTLGITDGSTVNVNATAQAGVGLAPQITDEDRIRALANLLARQKTEATTLNLSDFTDDQIKEAAQVTGRY